jgi:nucleobase:cation symporter-1, NCS1 family
MDIARTIRRVIPKMKAIPEWGIESVPQANRVFGFADFAVLWGNLGIGLLVMLAGTFLIPGLSLGRALLAVLVGNALGCALLALVGKVGSDSGLPTMVLLRSVLGKRGSYVPTALNVMQLLGWTVFEFIVMGVAADAIGKQLIGLSLYPLWAAAFALIAVLLGLGGPVGVVRQWLEKFAVWVAAASGLWLTFKLLGTYDLAALWKRPGDGSLPFWVAVDLVIALPVSWLPLVADYNRFASKPRRAFWGTALGFFATGTWFMALGSILMLGAKINQEPKDFTTAISLIAGWVALLILLADETHNAWADLYSTSVSIQNVFPKARQRWLIAALGALCLALAIVLDITRYQNFLYLIGSFFIPLFGVLVSHYFILRRREPRGTGSAEPGPAPRRDRILYGGLAAWLLGLVAYHVANPATLGAFFPAWQSLVPPALTSVGGSIPSFAVSLAAYAIIGALAPVFAKRRES